MKKNTFLLVFLLPCLCSCNLTEGRQQTAAPSEVTVRVHELSASGNEVETTYLGTVQSAKHSLVGAPVPGHLQKIHVKNGQKVHKGQVLATISSESVNAALDIATATLHQAEDGYARLMKLYEKGGVTEVKKVEVETQLSTARASYNAALGAKEKCTVTAPFSGTVEETIAHEGEEVALLGPIVSITDTDHLEIHFNVPENELGSIETGDTVTVEITALETSLKLPIGLKNASGNLMSHSYECTIYPHEKLEGLRPGMIVKVHKNALEANHAIIVPMSALFTGTNGRYVWVVQDGIVQKRQVTTEGYANDGMVVTSGLQAGDTVITEGARKVCSGMKVRVEP
ncbi:MAG: efflux RND transporter periplasmic adaptor subunit [Bacteroidales bacterium]|nr:efflux RND transporter periplasmic adaptor subunit [Bacteroidales bacterium]